MEAKLQPIVLAEISHTHWLVSYWRGYKLRIYRRKQADSASLFHHQRDMPT